MQPTKVSHVEYLLDRVVRESADVIKAIQDIKTYGHDNRAHPRQKTSIEKLRDAIEEWNAAVEYLDEVMLMVDMPGLRLGNVENIEKSILRIQSESNRSYESQIIASPLPNIL